MGTRSSVERGAREIVIPGGGREREGEKERKSESEGAEKSGEKKCVAFAMRVPVLAKFFIFLLHFVFCSCLMKTERHKMKRNETK